MEENAINETIYNENYTLPVTIYTEELRRVFEKLEKNRAVLCDEDGKLRADNARYATKYIELLNQVAKQGNKVLEATISHYLIPKNETGNDCITALEKLARAMSDDFKTAIRKRTFEEYMQLVSEYASNACEIYCNYIITHNMHEGLYAA